MFARPKPLGPKHLALQPPTVRKFCPWPGVCGQLVPSSIAGEGRLGPRCLKNTRAHTSSFEKYTRWKKGCNAIEVMWMKRTKRRPKTINKRQPQPIGTSRNSSQHKASLNNTFREFHWVRNLVPMPCRLIHLEEQAGCLRKPS